MKAEIIVGEMSGGEIQGYEVIFGRWTRGDNFNLETMKGSSQPSLQHKPKAFVLHLPLDLVGFSIDGSTVSRCNGQQTANWCNAVTTDTNVTFDDYYSSSSDADFTFISFY